MSSDFFCPTNKLKQNLCSQSKVKQSNLLHLGSSKFIYDCCKKLSDLLETNFLLIVASVIESFEIDFMLPSKLLGCYE